MLPDICHDGPGDSDLGMPATRELPVRPAGDPAGQTQAPVPDRAGHPGHDVVTVGWAFSEYRNAGGWPAHGFSQSSWPLVPSVRNGWIIWPAMVWVLATAGWAWFVFGYKPVSESEIKREMERQAADDADRWWNGVPPKVHTTIWSRAPS